MMPFFLWIYKKIQLKDFLKGICLVFYFVPMCFYSNFTFFELSVWYSFILYSYINGNLKNDILTHFSQVKRIYLSLYEP